MISYNQYSGNNVLFIQKQTTNRLSNANRRDANDQTLILLKGSRGMKLENIIKGIEQV